MKRYTCPLTARDPAVSPDMKFLIFIQCRQEQNRLFMVVDYKMFMLSVSGYLKY